MARRGPGPRRMGGMTGRENPSLSSLEDWRWKRLGPPWIRVSRSCVRYDLARLLSWLETRTIEEIPKAV